MTLDREQRPPSPAVLMSKTAADTIAELRRQIDGMRASARLRAVIEQAKGILVEREGIGLDEAFGVLRRLSQEHNVRLVEVAATIVGVTVPGDDAASPLAVNVLRNHLPASAAASTTWRSMQDDPAVRQGTLDALLDAVAGAPAEGDSAARLLFDLLAPYEPGGLTLYRTALDGSLRMIGSVEVPGDLASAWRNIPMSFDIPMTRSALERQSYFWADRESRLRDFPAVSRQRSRFDATAVVPVIDDDDVVGVVGLMWEDHRPFDDQTRQAIERSVQRIARLLIRHAVETDPDLDWMQALLSLHLDPWLLLDALPSPDSRMAQLVVQDVAPSLPEGTDWLGRRVLEIWPGFATDGTWESLQGLTLAGGFWTATISAPGTGPWGSPGTRVRAVRVGRRIVVVWRPVGG